MTSIKELQQWLKERGVDVYSKSYVYLEGLLPIFKDSQIVYCHYKGAGYPKQWGPSGGRDDTHTALLLDIQTIKKQSKEERAIELLRKIRDSMKESRIIEYRGPNPPRIIKTEEIDSFLAEIDGEK